MSKFIIVKEAPETLRKGEAVVRMPDFMDEVLEVSRKNSSVTLTGVNVLRGVLAAIGNRYDNSYNPFAVPASNYVGIAINSPADLSAVVIKMIEDHTPSLIDSYLTYMIKNRPLYTKVIYFIGPAEKGKLFHLEGFSPIDARDIDELLDVKNKNKKAKDIADE